MTISYDFELIWVFFSFPIETNIMPDKNDDNRSKQCNPEHKPTGPGHQAGYQGDKTKADLDNHGNQLNPNNERFQAKK